MFRCFLGVWFLILATSAHAFCQQVLPDGVQPEPEWIWSQAPAEPNQRAYFAFRFRLEQTAKIDEGAFVSDDTFGLWLDGEPWVRSATALDTAWLPVGTELEAGEHVLSLWVQNDVDAAGVLGYMILNLGEGQRQVVQTSAGWTCWDAAPIGWPLPAQPWDQVGKPSRSLGTAAQQSGPWAGVQTNYETPDPAHFTLPAGFVCERIYSAAPHDGSWSSMTFGSGGQLFVSGEKGALLRFELDGRLLDGKAAMPKPGLISRGAHVEDFHGPFEIPFNVYSAQGLEWAAGSLFAVVTRPADEDGGLHRLRDTDGDGHFDEHKHLAAFGAMSEHGSHAVRQGPDGNLYVLTGNYVRIPKWQAPQVHEDVLLPRIWDPLKHAEGIMAPGGQLWRTDLDGETWEAVAWGLRNPYDLAFSESGDAFTYDADMEWDLGAPWYRAPRLLHLLPEAEYGWRAGTSKWPAYFVDSLPAVLETGLASPTGIEFGTHAAFSGKFKRALFMGDWAWGRIIVCHLEPSGASFGGKSETFLEGRGVAITDLEVGPDGALWFIIGGRGTRSALYRVRQTGGLDEPAPQLDYAPAFNLRKALEAPNCPPSKAALLITHPDRHVAFAARLILERTPAAQWLPNQAQLTPHFALPLARAWPQVFQGKLAAREVDCSGWFNESNFGGDSLPQQLNTLRTAMVVHMRLARTPEVTSLERAWAHSLLAHFPTGSPEVDREIGRLLTAIALAPSDQLPQRFLAQMHPSQPEADQLHFALLLRLVNQGWTPELRRQYFAWFSQAANFEGGASMQGFLTAIRSEAIEQVPTDQRIQLLTLATPEPKPITSNNAIETLAMKPRSFVRNWSTSEVLQLAPTAPPNSTNGKSIFEAALCATCHRVGNQGGAFGPDLTSAARRFSRRDLIEAIVEPARNISDQYKAIPMPAGLLNNFSADEIANLLHYLENAADEVSPR